MTLVDGVITSVITWVMHKQVIPSLSNSKFDLIYKKSKIPNFDNYQIKTNWNEIRDGLLTIIDVYQVIDVSLERD